MFELLVILVLILILYFWWSSTYWSRRGVEGPNPLPFVGNMLNYVLARKHYGEVYQDIYEAFPKAAYVGIYRLLGEPALLVRDLELIKNIFIKDFNSFHDNYILVDKKLDTLAHINPFIAEGERWRAVRSQIGQLFTASKVKSVFPIIAETCTKLGKYIGTVQDVKTLEAKSTCAKYTIEVMASAGFGLEAEAFTNPNSYFTKYCESIFSAHFWSYFQNMGMNFCLRVAKICNTPYIPRDIQDWLLSIMKDVIRNRKQETTRRTDFLEMILNTKENSGEPISEQTVFGHCATLLLEGFETSSTTMAYCLYELARHPEILKRVQKEIDTVFTKYDNKLTFEAVNEMTYLESVFYEILRLHPAMLATMKKCTESAKLPPQYPNSSRPTTIPAGTIIVVPVLGVHFDPEIYPEPYVFDPNRFSEEAQKTRSKCAFLAFGEGPRICIGMRFGLAQSKAGIATLLRKYNVRLSPKTKVPVKQSPVTFLSFVEGGIWIEFEARDKKID